MAMFTDFNEHLSDVLKGVYIVVENNQVQRFLVHEVLKENLNFFKVGKGCAEGVHLAKLRIMDNFASDRRP
jgi:hypothetical protein